MKDLYDLKISALWNAFKAEGAAFWFLCTYFFFEYVRPQSIYPVLDVIPWAQISLILTMIAVVFNPNKVKSDNLQNKLIVVFSIMVVISSMLAFDPRYAWKMKEFFYIWVIVYFLVINVLNSEKKLFLFTLLFLLFSFKMSQNGFITLAERGFSFTSWGLVGAAGWFRNSGEFAIQMMIFLTLSISFIYALKDFWGKKTRIFFYMMPITAFFSVIGSSSRGGQLGLAIVGLWLLAKSQQRMKSLAFIIVASLLVVNFLPQDQIERFKDMGKDETSLQRMAYWDLGLEMLNDHPLVGVGYYNWAPYASYHYPNGVGPFGIIEVPHNIFLQASAELGYTGLILFLLMIFVSFNMNRKTRILSGRNRFLFYYAVGLDAGMIGFLVGGFFVTVLYYPFFWVQISLTTALYMIAVRSGFSATLSQDKESP